MSKRKVIEVRRHTMGLYVAAGGRSFPQAHLIYEVLYSDGSAKLERGISVHGTVGSGSLNAHTKAEKERYRLTERPDLFTHLHAAKLLMQDIEYACLIADGQVVLPELKKVRTGKRL